MKVTGVGMIFNSTQPGDLFRFYTDVVGLPPRPDAGEHAVDAGGVLITFDTHDQVKDGAREPARLLVNLFVDDVAAEEARLEGAGVRFIRKQGKEFWGGIISTFVDPDGNYVQLIEYQGE